MILINLGSQRGETVEQTVPAAESQAEVLQPVSVRPLPANRVARHRRSHPVANDLHFWTALRCAWGTLENGSIFREGRMIVGWPSHPTKQHPVVQMFLPPDTDQPAGELFKDFKVLKEGWAKAGLRPMVIAFRVVFDPSANQVQVTWHPRQCDRQCEPWGKERDFRELSRWLQFTSAKPEMKAEFEKFLGCDYEVFVVQPEPVVQRPQRPRRDVQEEPVRLVLHDEMPVADVELALEAALHNKKKKRGERQEKVRQSQAELLDEAEQDRLERETTDNADAVLQET
jgi:hypothetical protein